MMLSPKINKRPMWLLALSMAGCELIGPKLNDKLPIPESGPLPEAPASNNTGNQQAQKSVKTEIFDEEEAGLYLPQLKKQASPRKQRGMYNFQFNEADISEVAKAILGDTLQKNYSISPQVTGKVTLNTGEPVAKEELMPMLELLLSNYNAVMVEQGGVVLVKPAAEGVFSSPIRSLGRMQPGFQTQIIPVRNVSAQELMEVIKPLMPEKSLLQIEPRRNMLLVAGSSADMNRILDVVSLFDVDVLKGRSFALFTPAHVDAAKIIDELEPIFNPRSAGSGPASAPAGAPGAPALAPGENSFFRFIHIERLNAILAITHNAKYLRDVERWIVRLDKTDSEASGGVHVYRAQNVAATELADTLNDIFGNGASRGSSASIASGRRSLSATNRSSGSSSASGSGLASASGGARSASSGVSSSASGSSADRTLSDRSSNRNNNRLANSASGFGGGTNGNGELPDVKIVADEGNNALIVVANAEDYATVQKVIKELDVLPLQVLIDATIVEVKLKDELEYGVEWFFSSNHDGGSSSFGGGGGSRDAAKSGINLTDITKGVATGGFSYAFQPGSKDINVLLKAQAIKNNVNVISSPSLMVLNNQEASIKVGDSVPIRSSVSSNTAGASTGNNGTTGIIQTSQIQMVDTGINLVVRPRVNSSGLVLMDILQTANNVDRSALDTGQQGAGIDSPSIIKRELETSVAVHSGETLVLGGLIREDNTNNNSGVPLLHEIPLIGPLFGGTSRIKDKNELIVILTPRVVNSRKDAREITNEFRQKLSSIYSTP